MRDKRPITPYHHRQLRKYLREALAEYRGLRALVFTHERGSFDRETAVLDALDARRYWNYAAEDLRRGEARGVEVGAAWSDRGLANVRSANKYR